MFRGLIHRRDDMNAVVKFYHLRLHLADEALDLISGITISDDNYERAWNVILNYYDNKRRLVNSHMSEFFSVKSMKADTASELKRVSRETLNPIESLEALGCPVNQWDDVIVSHFTSNFDGDTRRDWEKYLKDEVNPPTLDRLKNSSRFKFSRWSQSKPATKPATPIHQSILAAKLTQILRVLLLSLLTTPNHLARGILRRQPSVSPVLRVIRYTFAVNSKLCQRVRERL